MARNLTDTAVLPVRYGFGYLGLSWSETPYFAALHPGYDAPAWETRFGSSLPWLGKQSFQDRVPKLELGNECRLGSVGAG